MTSLSEHSGKEMNLMNDDMMKWDKGLTFYVIICPYMFSVWSASPWKALELYHLLRNGQSSVNLVRFCGFSAANGHSNSMCEIYRIWNIKVFFDLWLFDDLKMSMSQLLVVSTKKKTVFQQSGAGTLQRSIEGMSTGHTLAAGDVALPGSSKFSNTRSKGYLGLYYYTKYNSYPQVGI